MFRALLHLVLEDFDGLVSDLDNLDLLKPTTDRVALAGDLSAELTLRPQAEVSSASMGKQQRGFSYRLLAAMTGNDAVSGGGGVVDIGWGRLAQVLARLAVKYRFRLPPYLALVARSLTTLE
eukprot:scaffold665454_cov39-Prasinocladus_malaysianus.AAC.1